MPASHGFKYHWFTAGDISASAIIIFDNLTVLTFMSLILTYGFNFPIDILLTKMIPGMVSGVMVGNLLCFYLSFRLAKKEQRQVTATPFGLDAPTTIGFAVLVVGPAFMAFQATGMDVHNAGVNSWHVGIGCVFLLGLIKLSSIFFASRLKAMIPTAALLGAIAGVAIAFIGFLPLVSIFKAPVVGLSVLGLILLTMYAKVRLPFNVSSLAAAIIVGTVLYYILMPFGLSGPMPNLSGKLFFMVPTIGFDFLANLHDMVLYVPVVIPFAFLVIFGNMAVAESSACLGEHYKVRDLLITDSIATLVIALCGGVSQTTAYVGFPVYKRLGARSGYLLINFFIVGIGGLCGLVGILVNLVPESALGPVLLFVAFEIAMQGFVACDRKYTVAILFAIFPSLARLVEIKLTDGSLMAVDKMQAALFANSAIGISDTLAVIILGNGFIITGTLWGALLCFLIDRQWWRGIFCSILLAVLSYFGIIHSIFISGSMYLPFSLPQELYHIPLQISIGYIFIAVMVFGLGLCRKHHPLTAADHAH